MRQVAWRLAMYAIRNGILIHERFYFRVFCCIKALIR